MMFSLYADLDIPDRAFAGCQNLSLIRMDDSKIRSAGDEAFLGCKKLEDPFPAKIPLDHVGRKAFSGCHFRTSGFFRALRDYFAACDITDLVGNVVDVMVPYRKWLHKDVVADRIELIKETAEKVVEEVLKTSENAETCYALTKSTVCKYYSMYDGSDWCIYFAMYWKEDILKRFHYIGEWEITRQWEVEEELHPPFRSIDQLTDEDVLRLIRYENSPRPLPWNWNDLNSIVNAELAGDAAAFPDSSAVDFLVQLIECRMNHRYNYEIFDIPNGEIEQHYFPTSQYFTKAEIMHALRHGALFNRLSVYDEIKRAYFQLACKENPKVPLRELK